jgi:hypothetical protein
MSKINIPTCTLDDSECNNLFLSISEKLNIQNPKFYYPIYNKIVDNAVSQSGLVFDSKFKVKQILSKVLDSDSDGFETDDNLGENEETIKTPESEVNSLSLNVETVINTEEQIQDILDTNTDIDIEKVQCNDDDNNDTDNEDDDLEIEEAINNIFTASALVERVNKSTGEKIIKEEKIHIKKSTLLEPLKVLKASVGA